VSGPRCFCRDCLADLDIRIKRCTVCGSPRLVRHRALPALTLAHIDCDAFYATVEKRDNPELNDHPVIIGGGKRGVVSAACYIARTYGVRSAMPMFKALDLCPEAKVIRPDMAKYVRVGREVRHAMQALTPLVEPLSIDEAFLALAGPQRVRRRARRQRWADRPRPAGPARQPALGDDAGAGRPGDRGPLGLRSGAAGVFALARNLRACAGRRVHQGRALSDPAGRRLGALVSRRARALAHGGRRGGRDDPGQP